MGICEGSEEAGGGEGVGGGGDRSNGRNNDFPGISETGVRDRLEWSKEGNEGVSE